MNFRTTGAILLETHTYVGIQQGGKELWERERRRVSRKRKKKRSQNKECGGATGTREVQEEPEEQGALEGKKRKREQV